MLDPLTMHDFAGDVAAVIEYLGAPATVLGNAFGNRVARCTAGDFPDLVERIILVCAGGQVEPDPELIKSMSQIFDPSLSDAVRLAAARPVRVGSGATCRNSEHAAIPFIEEVNGMEKLIVSLMRFSTAFTLFGVEQMQSVMGTVSGEGDVKQAMDKFRHAIDAMTDRIAEEIDDSKN